MTLPDYAAMEALFQEAAGLLAECLPAVDEDEEARAESWPDEVESGELDLTLASEVREFLASERAQASLGPVLAREFKGNEEGTE